MARSLWSGSIRFGLVNVPVKLYPAVKPQEVRFHLLHDADGARIQQKRVCTSDGEEVPWEHIAKGYEVAPHRYVMVTPAELKRFDPEGTGSIEISDFVEASEIDPVRQDATYYLAPDRGAARSYALLLEAMKRSKKVAVAQVVLRTRQHVCALRPMGKALVLSTLLYADEVIPVSRIGELESLDTKADPRELEMAVKLVESLSSRFDPRRYKDSYREKVLALLEKKARGEAIEAPPPAKEPSKVINLADALQASLEKARNRVGERGIRRAPTRMAARRGRRGPRR